MNQQTRVVSLAEKKLSLTDVSTVSGQFRRVDVENKLKCLFGDGMHRETGTGTVKAEAMFDLQFALLFP